MLRIADKILCWIEESLTVVAYLVMTAVVLWAVFCRYVLEIPFTFGDEAARYLMIFGVYLGISIGVRKGVHLGVEAFVIMLPPKIRAGVRVASMVFSTLMFIALAWATASITMRIYATGQHSSGLHLPMWVIYMVMPVGFALCCIRELQALYALGKQSRAGLNKEA
jgi:C4-dicarboxylate transporter DctQ subunit